MQASGNGPQQPFNPGYTPGPPIPPPSGQMSPNRMGAPQLRFAAIGEAWSLVKGSFGTWIPAILIVGLIAMVFSAVIGIATGTGIPGVPSPGTPPGTIPQPSYGPGAIIAQLLNFVVTTFLSGGLYRMAIKQVRGQAISLGDLFSATDVLGNLILASIVTSIATVLGMLACVVPGLVLTGLLMFTVPLIVDRRLSAMEAISTSFNALKPHWFMAFAFLFVTGLVAGLGVLACGIGLLFTAPIALVAIAIAYNDFFPSN